MLKAAIYEDPWIAGGVRYFEALGKTITTLPIRKHQFGDGRISNTVSVSLLWACARSISAVLLLRTLRCWTGYRELADVRGVNDVISGAVFCNGPNPTRLGITPSRFLVYWLIHMYSYDIPDAATGRVVKSGSRIRRERSECLAGRSLCTVYSTSS